MKLIKNGKIVLNGTRTEQETEDLLLAGLEIIVNTMQISVYEIDNTPILVIGNNIIRITRQKYDILKEILC